MLREQLLADIATDEAKLVETEQDQKLSPADRDQMKTAIANNIAHNKDAIAGLDKMTGHAQR
jgi:hypothetical protein